jgi:NAD(P)-dependent dehydrogenase (short-subunit alcohol dehydrogenase family)
MQRFGGKVVLITGAASGIGQATALRIAEEGGRIAAVDVNADSLSQSVHGLRELGHTAEAFPCDVSQIDQVRATVAAVVEHYGKLDSLCNVAGILRVGHSHEVTLELWNRIIAVNLTGTFLMCQAAIPHLIATRGTIVNTASTAALGRHPWMAAYAASKGGVISLSRCLSLEYIRQKLNVNVVIPGGFNTPLQEAFQVPEGADRTLIQGAMPKVRMGKPEQAAAVIAFLASSDARYMHGTEVLVDGGAMA